jgi:hypothetical protein
MLEKKRGTKSRGRRERRRGLDQESAQAQASSAVSWAMVTGRAGTTVEMACL